MTCTLEGSCLQMRRMLLLFSACPPTPLEQPHQNRMGVSHLPPGESRSLGVCSCSISRLWAGQLQTKLRAPQSQGASSATGCLPGTREAVGPLSISRV